VDEVDDVVVEVVVDVVVDEVDDVVVEVVAVAGARVVVGCGGHVPLRGRHVKTKTSRSVRGLTPRWALARLKQRARAGRSLCRSCLRGTAKSTNAPHTVPVRDAGAVSGQRRLR
jgi:hypothetical protein